MQKNIAVLGYGNLGQAIVKGLIKSDQFTKEEILIAEKNPETRKLAIEEGYNLAEDLADLGNSKLIILTVKPFACLAVLEELSKHIKSDDCEVISFVSSITVEEMETAVKGRMKIIRGMTNLAVSSNQGVLGYSTNKYKPSALCDLTMNSLGIVMEMEENMLDALTVISGCGVGFVLRYIRALSHAALQIGFDVKSAEKIVEQTMAGTLSLLESGEHPERIIDTVATPKGLTIYGLNEMEHNGFSSSLIKAVVATHQEFGK